MDRDLRGQVIEQLDFYWREQFRPRLEGMTDEEYVWEPVPGAWNLRPRSEARTSMAAGGGDLVLDWEWPEPDPPPVTTIAWRIGHIGCGVLGMRASNHFGDGSTDYQTTVWPSTAIEAIDYLDQSYGAWRDGISKLSEEDLWKPVGPAEGPYAQSPYIELILHINREAIHHAAEIALLRDLYRARSA
ncbi:MAG TPA: DinB family protein [Actinomycetota bacterium]|nr:DinB family protein [Actinomycetota bacterium]